jgi:hypothetical protein
MSQQEKINNIAQKILAKTNIPTDDRYGSPILLLMLVSIILTCIRIVQECDSNQTKHNNQHQYGALFRSRITDLAKKRHWLTRYRLKRILRQKMTYDDYKKYSNDLLIAILNYGETITEDETITLMEAADV